MPHKLSNVKADARVSFHQDAPSKNPEMAARILRVMSSFGRLDGEIGLVFARLLRTEAHLGIAIYNQLVSTHAQDAALKAVAPMVLEDDELDFLMGLIELGRGHKEIRNDMAHGIWGYSEDLPKALLLINPRDTNRLRGSMATVWERQKIAMANVAAIEPALMKVLTKPIQEEISVFREKDTNNLANEVQAVYNLWDSFAHYRWPNDQKSRDEAHRRLLEHNSLRSTVNDRRRGRGQPELPPL